MTLDEKIVEAVARAIAVAQGFNSDANQIVSVPVIVSGRLTDTGHDTRIMEKRDRVSAPAWHRFLCAARAAITAYQAEAWQPIETAPKDGTAFLGIGPLDSYPQPMRWDAYDKSDAEELGVEGYWAYCEELIGDVTGAAEPTHWQPLPPAPKASP